MTRIEILDSIFKVEQEIKDINQRISNEPIPIHYSMLAEAQTRLKNLQNELNQLPTTNDPIESQILSIQNQINNLPYSDFAINIRSDLLNQISSLKAQANKQTSIILPNQLNQLGQLENPQTKGLLLIGGLVIGAILLKN